MVSYGSKDLIKLLNFVIYGTNTYKGNLISPLYQLCKNTGLRECLYLTLACQVGFYLISVNIKIPLFHY